jgi:uncharacterized membrane protein YhhN
MASDPSPSVARPPRGWPLFLLGVLLFFLGPVIYAVQLAGLGQTTMPWHMLILASVGVLLMAASVWRRFGVLRTIGVVVFGLLAVLEWTFFLAISRTPEYTGPALAGTKVPAFATTLADGRSFGSKNLEAGEATVILFNRGHW